MLRHEYILVNTQKQPYFSDLIFISFSTIWTIHQSSLGITKVSDPELEAREEIKR